MRLALRMALYGLFWGSLGGILGVWEARLAVAPLFPYVLQSAAAAAVIGLLLAWGSRRCSRTGIDGRYLHVSGWLFDRSVRLSHVLWLRPTRAGLEVMTARQRLFLPADDALMSALQARCRSAFWGDDPAFARLFRALPPDQRAAVVAEILSSESPQEGIQRRWRARQREQVLVVVALAATVVVAYPVGRMAAGLRGAFRSSPPVPRSTACRLILHTVPAGARVAIDGRDVGKSPLVIHGHAEQIVKVSMRMRGRTSVDRYLVLQAGDNRIDQTLEIPAACVGLRIWPVGAEVLVNGKPRGRAEGDLMVLNLPPGKVELEVKAPGYVPFLRHLQVHQGDSSMLTVTLEGVPVAVNQVAAPHPAASAYPTSTATPEAQMAALDARARDVPESEAASIDGVARALTAGCAQPQERARLLYAWVAQHITYDVAAFESGKHPDQSADAVFQRRTAVCAGYAYLYQALCQAVDIPCQVVPGDARSGLGAPSANGPKPNHAWNAVQFGNRWYLVDATWGAGSMMQHRFVPHYTPFWFCTSPEAFIYTHLPQDPQWQQLSAPLSWQDWQALPSLKPQFFEYSLALPAGFHVPQEPVSSLDLTLSAPTTVEMMADVLDPSGQRLKSAALMQRSDRGMELHVRVPGPGRYRLVVFAGPMGAAQVEEALSIDLQGRSDRAGDFPLTYGDFQLHNAYLYAPFDGTLPARSQTFRLRVPGASKVAVVVNGHWHELNASGDLWTGDTPLEPGTVYVMANFDGSSYYHDLLQYQAQ
ncbi:MAG: transglutaminase domain-containing protein [Candidatus Xenobia bacterium]